MSTAVSSVWFISDGQKTSSSKNQRFCTVVDGNIEELDDFSVKNLFDVFGKSRGK